jgi:hypothetical protein
VSHLIDIGVRDRKDRFEIVQVGTAEQSFIVSM